MIRPLPLLLLCSAATAMDGDYLGLDTHISHQLVLSAGLSGGVVSGEVPQPDPLIGTLTHELDSSWRPGPALGVAWQRTSWNGDGDGWHLELGISVERWNGQLDGDTISGTTHAADGAVMVDAGLVTVAGGLTWCWDSDLRLAPRTWQLDLAPVVGLGTARCQVDDSAWSESGPAWSVGARVRLSTALGAGWRLGGQVGASWSQASVRWTNTDTATFDAFGPTVALVLMLGE